MSLQKEQCDFTKLVPRLIDKAFELGFEVTLGDAYRDPRVHGALGVKMSYSHPSSAHKVRLAIDLNLFKNGKFLEAATDHEPLGVWWEQQDSRCRWGGRFADGNHYSFEHNGVK